MKKNFYKSFWFWLIVFGVLIFIGNILVLLLCPDNSFKSNLLTLISGLVSGIATLAVGLIAYNQSRQYQNDAKVRDHYVDIIIESVQVVTHSIPINVMGRKCVPQNLNDFGHSRFLLTAFAYGDNPIFNILIANTEKDNKIIVNYDSIQPIQPGPYGRTFLSKNEFMQLAAEIPDGDNFSGKYILLFRFENQFGETFQKKLFVQLKNDRLGFVVNYSQEKASLMSPTKNFI